MLTKIFPKVQILVLFFWHEPLSLLTNTISSLNILFKKYFFYFRSTTLQVVFNNCSEPFDVIWIQGTRKLLESLSLLAFASPIFIVLLWLAFLDDQKFYRRSAVPNVVNTLWSTESFNMSLHKWSRSNKWRLRPDWDLIYWLALWNAPHSKSQ